MATMDHTDSLARIKPVQELHQHEMGLGREYRWLGRMAEILTIAAAVLGVWLVVRLSVRCSQQEARR